ncbi:hypothetical protein BSKO_04963 [Bryopsis sp. KO-2023]|nr:hypothetical protein BSKO_04963 [Bryopsis sp. KO-2023]
MKSTLVTLVACAVAATVAGACYLWRGKKKEEVKPPASSLDATTGALVKFHPRLDHSAEDEDSWLRSGSAVAAVEVHGPLTVFFVDTCTSFVYSCRSSGAAIRPSDGDGVVLVMPDWIFTRESLDDFYHRLSVAAASGLPLCDYHGAVADFFAEHGVDFPTTDLPPYWLAEQFFYFLSQPVIRDLKVKSPESNPVAETSMWSSTARTEALLRTFSSSCRRPSLAWVGRSAAVHRKSQPSIAPRYRVPERAFAARLPFSTRVGCSVGQTQVATPQHQQTLGSEADGNGAEGKAKSTAYPFTEVEEKWQAYWAENKTFRTPEDVDMTKPKFYVLDMFPYPSGSGLHVGHPEGYTATDIIARYKRMKGFNVLHPMGWDAFGLPAEQYALQTNTHPRVTTEKNVNRFREQLQSLGFSYDWDREIATTDPNYYRWTQWIFLQLFERGLAYQAEVPVNWCPALGTVLANEEVIDGKSERGDHPVFRLPMKQWMLKITAYADRLLEDLDDLDWSDSIKQMQRNWIGRSEGAEIFFEVLPGEGSKMESGAKLEVYTTRPDTLFGATYMVVAPEHPSLSDLVSAEKREEVEQYAEKAARKSDLERTELQKEKSGVFTGSWALNPATGDRIPIWVADYVLGGYGSGAIMAVPAHDSRDFEFANTFDLPITPVISGSEQEADLPFTGAGVNVNSSNEASGLNIDGMGTEEAQQKVLQWLESKNIGSKKVNYKLRDWLFARQRYWGEPFPILYPEGSEEPVAVPEDQLPLTLPDTDTFKPSGTPESPLANITDWVETTDPKTGRPARRETSTMPQWAGSCWYYLRFIDPDNITAPIDPEKEKYWMPVDLYIGGAEHAVLHLLYARFWHKVLYDLGVVTTKEPFGKLVSQGMILGEVEYSVFKNSQGEYVKEKDEGAEAISVEASDVEKKGDGYVLKSNPEVSVAARVFKMSKSRGNVINPDDIVMQYGADSLRLYEMFMGPLIDTKIWSTRSVEGVHRFLARVNRLFEQGCTDDPPSDDQLRLLHTTIKKVSEDTEELRFNTAISSMMEFSNGATKWKNRPRAALEPFVKLLSPYAPHLAEELWSNLGHPDSLAYEDWPIWEEKILEVQVVKIAVQTNGKMRGMIEIGKDEGQDAAMEAAKQLETVQRQIDGKDIKKVIFVPGKILNIIAK